MGDDHTFARVECFCSVCTVEQNFSVVVGPQASFITAYAPAEYVPWLQVVDSSPLLYSTQTMPAKVYGTRVLSFDDASVQNIGILNSLH